ncbi:hypothetical protein GEMRC1_009172 [Eukaryota sp. GEM-RC1]
MQNVTVIGSSVDSLISLQSSNISISQLAILNSTGNILVIAFDSVSELNSCLVRNSSFNSFLLLTFSDFKAISVQSMFSNYSSNFLSLSNSTANIDNFVVYEVFSTIFLKSLDSVTVLKNTVIKNFNFVFFLNFYHSNVTFFNLSKTDCVSSSLNYSVYDVIMVDSEFTLENSSLSGCASNNLFKNRFCLENSRIVLINLESYLFVSSFSLINSNCSVYSNFPIISKSLEIDDVSVLIGSPSVVDLSELATNISISPSKQCCNTSVCQPKSSGFLSFRLSKPIFEHSKSFNNSSPSVILTFAIEQILYDIQLIVPICPIEFVSLEPPTRGGFVPLFAFNLGIDPIVIHHSTAWINETLEYSSNNHQILNILFFEGHGCHEMVISRSTDVETVFFHYCFKQPFIESVSPNPFPLTGKLILKGSDFSTNFEFFSLLSSFPQVDVFNYTHDEIILDIPYICDINSTKFEIVLVIGNQSSNSYQLNFGPPRVTYQPVPLSPTGETILLHGPNFSKMFNCFPNSYIEFAVSTASFNISSDSEMTVRSGELYGSTEFVILIEFFKDFNFLISIPVTSFIARNTSYVCFVGLACEIDVYSYLETFSFLETYIEPNVPDSIYFLYFGSTESSAVVTFISYVPGVPQDLKICANFGCFSIFNLPFVVQPAYLSPKHVQWLNEPLATEVLVEVEGISSYCFYDIQNSFYFDNCESFLSDVTESSLIFNVEFYSTGICTLMGVSFLDVFPISLSVEAKNFVIFPPEVNLNSRIEFILTEDIHDLFISYGNQNVPVNLGTNIVNLMDSSSFITLYRFSQSTNISSVAELLHSEIPTVVEVNYHQSHLIDLNLIKFDLEISCSDNCDLNLHYLQNSTLIHFLGIDPGLIYIEFLAFYLTSSFYFQLPITVESPPVFELFSPNVVTTFDDSLIVVYSYSYFNLNSTFLIDNSEIEPTTVELISSSDSFFVYRFELNLTSMSVFEGEYAQDLCWTQIGFKRQLVSEIQFFNLEFSSNDHVSVFEHRDISVDFRGNLTSNVTCSIDDQMFFGKVADNVLVCENVRIPTFQQHVWVDVYYDHFLLNSFELSGEAFFGGCLFHLFSTSPVSEILRYYFNS